MRIIWATFHCAGKYSLSIEELCEILYSNSEQLFEDFAGDEVVPW
jgi:hypothetical protein